MAMTETERDTRALDELCINTIRTLSMDAVQKANSGHPGTPMALAPVGYVLFTRLMRHSPADPRWPDRDRFVLSAGHASMLLYSLLYLTGYGLELDDLEHFRRVGSRTAGHPEYWHAPGIEATTGPLGQGISTCTGLALAERMLAARYNRDGHDIVSHYTWTIASDGDLEEGISNEAGSLAGHLGLGGLIAFYDNNHVSIEGDTEIAFTENVGMRYEALGWHVQNLGEDIALDRLEAAARAAMEVKDRPSLIIIRTHIAEGSPDRRDDPSTHGSPLGEADVRLAKENLGFPPDEHFYVPAAALEHFRASVERGQEFEREWDERFAAYRDAYPELAAQFEMVVDGRLPEGFGADPPRFDPAQTPSIATRKASHEVIQWAAAEVPNLVGGSADLAPSTLTLIDGAGDVEANAYDGRNMHFGIREHAMGAIVNGLGLHYFRAFGATFLIFSDYMKGSIRIAALMGVPSIFVFTHDSIGLGEDGPTHQPIEQLTHLRATPNLYVVRPADANETALAWRFALQQKTTPTALALSRQGLPVWRPSAIPDDAVDRGAYVLRESYKGPDPDLILVATGSEVHLCNSAADLLEAGGVATRLVSMPCMDRFAEQDSAYRDKVLPPSCHARVAVEAGSPMSWYRWVGDYGGIVGMTTFGASGPGNDVFEHFGFTADRVAQAGRSAVERANS